MSEIGIGIVGLGSIARTHLIALNSMNLVFEDLDLKPVFRGLCTRKGSSQLNIFEKETDDLSELLADEKITMIDICTPNFLHYEQGREVIAAGKNIYMEKPIAVNIVEGKELLELSNKRGLINQTALTYRFMPAVVMARDLIKNGRLGDILNFRVRLFHKGYLNEDRPISWRLQEKTAGGGALMDLGIHMADLTRFLLGEVKELRARTSTYFKERYRNKDSREKVAADVDEWACLDLSLENGGYGTLEVSRISTDIIQETIFEIYGTEGKLKISSRHPDYPEVYLHKKGQLVKGEFERTGEFSKYHQKIYPGSRFNMGWFINAHLASLINFMLNIGEGTVIYNETPTFSEALKSQKIIEMGYTSAREDNRLVQIDNI